MTTWYKWSVKCATDNNRYFTITESDTAPTVCPDNSSHSLVANSAYISKRLISQNKKATREDGRSIVTIARFPSYYEPVFTGEGDDFANGSRFDGQKLLLSWADGASVTNTTQIRFVEPVGILGGMLRASNGNTDDYVSMVCKAPATPAPTSNAGSGNCNLTDLGGYNIIIPAAGDGSHDVDITSAVNANLDGTNGITLVTAATPVPAFDSSGEPNGYWDWSESDGSITAAPNGDGSYNLFDVEITMVTYVRKCWIHTEDPTFEQTFDIGHKSGEFLPHWIVEMTTTRASSHQSSDPAVIYNINLFIARRNSN